MKCLEMINVSYRYDAGIENVINNFSASFESGKVYTIIGQSGAGKSTLLSLLSGLDLCKEGDILYNGKSLRNIDRDIYRSNSVGVIFQSYNLLLNSSAAYNITLSMNISRSGAAGRRAKKDYAYALLDKVGIDRETADRKVLKLSGGEQQRVGIARALSHDPDVIIADEPTGNLDAETEAAVLEIMTRLAHEDKKCVIIVTHSENVTAAADEVIGLGTISLLSRQLRGTILKKNIFKRTKQRKNQLNEQCTKQCNTQFNKAGVARNPCRRG